jgi:hypothetical protein
MEVIMEGEQVKDHWKIRLGVSVTLLVLSFIGMIITDFIPEFALTYWSIMIPVFALLCLWMSWIDYHDKRKFEGITLWHELLHWIATLVAVYMVAVFVRAGFMSNVIAGLFVLMLLALSIFIAGIYIDFTFILIGILLGLFAVATVLFFKYLFIITIPLSVAVLITLFYFYWRRKKKPKTES